MSVVQLHKATPELIKLRADCLESVKNYPLHPVLTKSGRDLLCYLTQLIDLEGRFRRSIKSLANLTGLSVSTVNNQLKILEARGLLERINHFNDTGTQIRTNEYILNLPPIDDFNKPPLKDAEKGGR